VIHLIKSITDKFFALLIDDPVRPDIPHTDRIGDNKDVFVLREEEKVSAVTCVAYQHHVPKSQSELFQNESDFDLAKPNVAVFYTIWSYEAGAGRKLIFDAVEYIKENKPEIERIVTLSPKTKLAQKFHLRNGAFVFRENDDTINYEYQKDAVKL